MLDILKLEASILGSMILDKTMHKYLEDIDESDFLDNGHKNILKSLKHIVSENNELNYFELAEKSKVDINTVIALSEAVVTTSQTPRNVANLKDKSSRRKIIEKAEYIKKLAMDNDQDIDDIKNNSLQEISEIKTMTNDEVMTLKDAMINTIGVLEKRSENKDDKSYYTRLGKLDVATAGLHKEELTTIAARPGVGKTAIAMQIGMNIAMNKKKIMFSSLEMSSVQLCQRIIAANSGIDGNDLRRGNLTENGWKQTISVGQAFSLDNFIIDKSSKKPQHIRSKIRKYKPELVIIDYLQLLQPDVKSSSREQDVASMTRALKLMTLEFQIPIIILSQLNRNAEGKRPTLGDLRESGAIEQDSDNIIFLHRLGEDELDRLVNEGTYDYRYIAQVQNSGNIMADVILEKQRNGPTGTFGMIYSPKIMKFLSISDKKVI